MCLSGYGVVRKLLDTCNTDNLKGFIAWIPMLAGDGIEPARQQAADLHDSRVTHSWDGERELGNLYSKTLGLSVAAWDVYMLYKPGIGWEEDEPPKPTFWMHQLSSNHGADQSICLDPARLSNELELLIKAQ